MEEVRAHTEDDAINQVQDRFLFDNFGQGGALTEHDVAKETEYLNGDFSGEIE